VSTGLPVYDATYPAISQNDSWSCSPTTTRWMLYSLGRTPSEQWIESTMIAEGVANPTVGCTDKSGAGLAAFVTRHYGYQTGNNGYEATFDELRDMAGDQPMGFSGGAWYHWSGLRGYDSGSDLLLLANPASGYMGVTQTMNRSQFAQLGPWSYFWIVATLPSSVAPDPIPDSDFTPWAGKIGTGILDLMAQDSTLPAQEYSTWLPLGRNPADVEEAYGRNGVRYAWLLSINQGFRY